MSHPEYKNVGDPAMRLVEECSELIKAVCKGQRFGWGNHHPDCPDIDNLQDVDAEMTDVIEAYNDLRKGIVKDLGK